MKQDGQTHCMWFWTVNWSPITPRTVSWPPIIPRTVTWPPITPRTVNWSLIIPRTVSWSLIIPRTLNWSPIIPRTISWPPIIPRTVTWPPIIPRTVTWPLLHRICEAIYFVKLPVGVRVCKFRFAIQNGCAHQRGREEKVFSKHVYCIRPRLCAQYVDTDKWKMYWNEQV